MTLPAPTYDLVMLLDLEAEEETRAKILEDTRKAIAAKGELVRDDDWGSRALAYPIERKANAEYHLLQFHANTPELLGELSRTLRITDGIVRFRIVKLKPGTPDAPDMHAGAAHAKHAETHHDGDAPPAPTAETPPPAEEPPPPAEPPPEVAVGEPA